MVQLTKTLACEWGYAGQVPSCAARAKAWETGSVPSDLFASLLIGAVRQKRDGRQAVRVNCVAPWVQPHRAPPAPAIARAKAQSGSAVRGYRRHADVPSLPVASKQHTRGRFGGAALRLGGTRRDSVVECSGLTQLVREC